MPATSPTEATRPVATHDSIWSWAGLAGFAIGALSAAQSRMNGQLSVSLGEPMYAALWSFGSGWVLLTLILAATPSTRAGLRRLRAAVRARALAWWLTLGGLLGATYVLVQVFAVPIAGVAVFTVAVVAGQTASALVVDRFGLGPSGPAPVTGLRVFAAALATVGVVVAVQGRVTSLTPSPGLVLAVLLALFVGGLHAVQSATNGRVNVVTGTPWATVWLNFMLGVTLLAAVALGRLVTGHLEAPRLAGAQDALPWWVWFGGLAGVVFIGVSAVVVRHLGVLHTMLVVLLGQLSSAAVLDLANPATRHTVTPVVLLGLVVTAVAAGTTTLPSVRRCRPPHRAPHS